MKTSKLNEKIQTLNPRATQQVIADLGYNVIIGGYLFVKSEMENTDWHYYSKAWHRAHGPRRTVTDRKVTIYSYNGRCKNPMKIASVINFDGWNGNVLLRAIKESWLFTEPNTKTPLSVRLDKFYDAKLTRTIGNIKIYERTLLESHIDYCAVLNGITFHAKTEREAVRGVHAKIKVAFKKRNSPINLKLCKELGFCDAGIKEFCNVFDINIKGDYSPGEIESMIKANPDKAAPFESELRTVAKTLSYKTSI